MHTREGEKSGMRNKLVILDSFKKQNETLPLFRKGHLSNMANIQASLCFLGSKNANSTPNIPFFPFNIRLNSNLCANSVSREKNSKKNATAFYFFHFSLDIFVPHNPRNQTCLIYATLDH
mgnify:CR=1 FL=1